MSRDGFFNCQDQLSLHTRSTAKYIQVAGVAPRTNLAPFGKAIQTFGKIG